MRPIFQGPTALRFLCNTSLVSLFVLILAGGVVRSSGSGMGCPDWPKCFNRIIPPTRESQLPMGYKEAFVHKRMQKNARLILLLRRVGWVGLADRMAHDPTIAMVEPYNGWNTWAEYINRLIGLFTGFSFLFFWLASIPEYRKNPKICWISGLNLLFIVLQAFVGSVVVSTNLLPGLITFHMMLALVILFLLLLCRGWVLETSGRMLQNSKVPPFYSVIGWCILLGVGISLVQILLGTGVRETLDQVGDRLRILQHFDEAAGPYFLVHREVSLFVLFLNLGLAVFAWRQTHYPTHFKRQLYISLALVILQMGLGISLEMGHLPPFSQAVHVFVAVLLLGSQFWTWTLYRFIKSPAFAAQSL